MKNKPKISVIIPVYNSEKYLRQCLDSVVNQTFKDIEIICVNDGSTDDSLNILREYEKKYNNLKVINQENKGAIQARINGYKKSSGDYIGWVDNDDFLDKNMYKKMYERAKNENADVVECNYNFYPNNDTNKKKWFKEYSGKNDYEFINQNTLLWNKIVKKEYLEKLNFEEIFKKCGEGSYGLILINSNKIITLNENLYNYRVGHLSLSGNYQNVDWYEKTIERSKNQLEYVKKKIYSDYWVKYYEFCYLYYILVFMIISAYNKNIDEYKHCKKKLKENRFFSLKYKRLMLSRFSYVKYCFLKYIAVNSYLLSSIISKKVLKIK